MRRRATIIATFILLGAIVNIAVAWACSVWVVPSHAGSVALAMGDWPKALMPPYADEPVYAATRWRGLGITETDVHFAGPVSFAKAPGFQLPFETRPSEEILPSAQVWAENLAEQTDEIYREFNAAEDRVKGVDLRQQLHGDIDRVSLHVATGWPLRSVEGWIASSLAAQPRAGLGIALWHEGRSLTVVRTVGTTRIVRAIPYSPVLPGFLFNTLLYALLLWLLVAGPIAIRRALRRKRRLCERCAYPIGTWGGAAPSAPNAARRCAADKSSS